MFSWLKQRRRQRWLAEPASREWLDILQENVRHWRHASDPQRQRLLTATRIMVAEKDWSGSRGFEVDEAMRVTIAGQAAVMLLGVDDYYFDGVQTVVVHPGASLPGKLAGWEEEENDDVLLGQLWHRGPIVLAWKQVLRAGREASNGLNVVFHEFAHYLDGLDGHLDGIPNLLPSVQHRWYRVVETEFLRLVGSAERGEATLLDHYGATNLTEFFAVASECFFERPRAMRERHAELYQMLGRFYRQDPAEWLPDHGTRERDRRPRGKSAKSAAGEDLQTADDFFARGVERLDRGQAQRAIDDFSRVLDLEPGDAEALAHRAAAYHLLGHDAEALADCDAALRIDAHESLAWRTRGSHSLAHGEGAAAVEQLNRAIEADPDDTEANFLRGLAFLEQGHATAAADDFRRCLRADPHDAEAHYALAESLERLGQAKEADASRRRALNLDPNVAGRLQDRGASE